MELLHPWMLLGLLLVPAVVLLHVFRVPGRRHEVSYLGLWRRVLAGVRPESAERTRRFNWLLLVEILIIVLLVVALAGPIVRHRRPRRHVAFIIDTSASMNTAEPDGRSRWQLAVSRVGDVLDRLDADDRVSAYLAPAPERTLVDTSAGELADLLAGLGPGEVAIAPDVLLERGLAAVGEGPQVLYVVSDGPPPAGGEFGGRLRIVRVGGVSRNVGIVGFSVSQRGDGQHEVFARMRNCAAGAVTRSLLTEVGTGWRKAAEVTIAAGGVAERVIVLDDLPPHGVLRVKLDGEADGLAADDEVAAVRGVLPVVGVGTSRRAVYAGLFGGKVFENTVYLEADDVRPGVLPAGALLIVLGRIPQALGAMTVLIDPPAGEIAGVTVGDAKRLDAPGTPVADASPLLRNCDVSTLRIREYHRLTLGEGARRLLTLNGDVVAASGGAPEGPVIVLGFDPEGAGWPLEQSFVVFWTNVYDAAGGGTTAPGCVRTGETVRLPAGKTGGELTGPGGTRRVTAGPDGWANVQPASAGVYTWNAPAGRRTFAANLLSETESDNRVDASSPADLSVPVPALEGRITPIGPWLGVLGAMLAVAWWHLRQ